MAIHRDLPDGELHEPKHIQAATTGADAGKVIVAKGDGTSELRKLARADIPSVDNALSALEAATSGGGAQPSGVYLDTAAVTGTVDVTIEDKQYYFIGPAPSQTVTFQLPDPSTVTMPITLKRISDQGSLLVVPFGAELVEGVSSLSLLIKDNALTFVSDGTDWRIV